MRRRVDRQTDRERHRQPLPIYSSPRLRLTRNVTNHNPNTNPNLNHNPIDSTRPTDTNLYSKTMKLTTSFRRTSPRKPSRRRHIYEQTASGTILAISLRYAPSIFCLHVRFPTCRYNFHCTVLELLYINATKNKRFTKLY